MSQKIVSFSLTNSGATKVFSKCYLYYLHYCSLITKLMIAFLGPLYEERRGISPFYRYVRYGNM